MLIDDALKNTVKTHLANWKTLRGETPFYSGMFWPQNLSDQTDQSVDKIDVEVHTEFPNILFHCRKIFSSDDLMRAVKTYPEHKSTIMYLEKVAESARKDERLKAKRSLLNLSAPENHVTIDMVEKAFSMEKKQRESEWSTEQILNFAIKLKAFREGFKTDVRVRSSETPYPISIKIDDQISFAANWELRHSRPKNIATILNKHGISSVAIQKKYDLAAIAADIASQGHDVLIWSETGKAFCVTGVQSIKSIRAMGKHLNAILPTEIMEELQRNFRNIYEQYEIRPLVNAKYGLRFFVTNGDIVAATVQNSDAEPMSQTEPFVGYVGLYLKSATDGPYQTIFEETHSNAELFGAFLEKAKEISSELRDVGVRDYALDLLMDDSGNYTFDLFNLLDVDYHALCPSVIITAVKEGVIANIRQNIPHVADFTNEELVELINAFTISSTLPVKFTHIQNEKRHRGFGQKLSFQSMIGNVKATRDLLRGNGNQEISKTMSTDEKWLRQYLAISEQDAHKFELQGFIAAVRNDLNERFDLKKNVIRNPHELFLLVPLLDAARWYRGQQMQSWRYCRSNQSETYLTVRPADSVSSRSEKHEIEGYEHGVERLRRYIAPAILGNSAYDKNADDIGLEQSTSEWEKVEDANVTDFFMTLLEDDD